MAVASITDSWVSSNWPVLAGKIPEEFPSLQTNQPSMVKDDISWKSTVAQLQKPSGQPQSHDHRHCNLTVNPYSEPFDTVQLPIQTDSFVTLASIIRQHGVVQDLPSGRHLHAQLSINQLDDDTFVANCLVQMYGDCGSMEDARAMFDDMPSINLHSWNILINAYVKNGLYQEAMVLFHHMQDDNFKPNHVTFVSILNAFIRSGLLEEGRLIHAAIIDSEHYGDVVVRTALVNFYGKCGSLADARAVFQVMPHKNVVSWNAMIAVYAHNGHGKEALDLFDKMKTRDLLPNQATFVCILDACATNQALELGHGIHGSIIESGFEGDVVVGTALIDMYSKCGSLDNSKRLFSGMPQRNVISWSAIVAACVHNGDSKEAMELFHNMEHAGFTPNRVTIISAVDACAGLAHLEEGWKLHAVLIDSSYEGDVVVGTSLVNMYGKCGSLDDAKDVFDEMQRRDVITWSAMVGACAQNGNAKEALDIFHQMQMEGFTPNGVTFVCALDACTSVAFLEEGQKIHAAVTGHGYETDLVVGTALIGMYGKCGSLHDAKSVWRQMPHRNVVSLNAMVAACTHNGQGKEALDFFHQMYVAGLEPNLATFVCALDACASLGIVEEGQKIHSAIVDSEWAGEVGVGNALIVMYGKCGSPDDAKSVLYKMSQWDVVSWSAMIAVCAQNGSYKEALDLFYQIQLDCLKPNYVTFVCALDACSGLEALDEGWKIHAAVVSSGHESEIAVGNALVNMYGKSGSMSDAMIMFERLPERDLISWNTMIATCAQNGHDTEVLDLFSQMQHDDIKPDKITFHSVLTACSHAGRVNDARYFFRSLKHDHGLTYTLDLYMCMVDLLGRAGHLDDAEDLIKNMPFEKNAMIWSCLLGSCKIHGDVKRAVRAADHVFTLDSTNDGPYVTLANIYAAADMWDDVRKLQEAKTIL